MKLLFLTGHASRAGGGVSVAVRDLARALVTHGGCELRVAAIRDGDAVAEEEPEWRGLDVRTFSVVGPRKFGASPTLLRALLAERYDVVHIQGLWRFHGFAALFARAPHGLGAPLVVSPHGMLEPWILARSPRTKAMVSALFQRKLLRHARVFHVLSDKEADDVRRIEPGADCVVVPNIVLPAAVANGRPGWWRAGFEQRRVFLFLGRLHKKKGIAELCDGWSALCERDAAFRDGAALAICGPLDGIPELPARVAALDERFGNTVFGGAQYGLEKDRSFRVASFLCLPSKSEGVPLTILEAWAAGVPAIMTPECNLPEGFSQGAALRTGHDGETIARTLFQAFNLEPAVYQAMTVAGRKLAAESFSVDAVLPQMLALYEKALR